MIWLILCCFIIHIVSDSVFQSRDMGKQKSTNIFVLIQHITIIFACFFFGLSFILGTKQAFLFSLTNSLVHGVIDWYIWRGYKAYAILKLHKKASKLAVNEPNWNIPYEERFSKHLTRLQCDFQYWEDKQFYTTIVLDQSLHLFTLILLLEVFYK